MDLMEYLGVRQRCVRADLVELELTVTSHHIQPHGILHGGMNAVLAETAASLGAQVGLPEGKVAVGTQVISNHIRPVALGQVVLVQAQPVQQGNKLQLWQVKTLVENQITSTSQVQLMVIEPQK